MAFQDFANRSHEQRTPPQGEIAEERKKLTFLYDFNRYLQISCHTLKAHNEE
jgi:hypothetical protein